MPKVKENQYTKSATSPCLEMAKLEIATELGFNKNQISQFQKLADEMPDDVCKLFLADIQDGLPQIADNSVDFIITDPPYPKEFIPLYGELSKVAARVLKNGGSLVCMCGQTPQLWQNILILIGNL